MLWYGIRRKSNDDRPTFQPSDCWRVFLNQSAYSNMRWFLARARKSTLFSPFPIKSFFLKADAARNFLRNKYFDSVFSSSYFYIWKRAAVLRKVADGSMCEPSFSDVGEVDSARLDSLVRFSFSRKVKSSAKRSWFGRKGYFQSYARRHLPCSTELCVSVIRQHASRLQGNWNLGCVIDLFSQWWFIDIVVSHE